MSRPPKVPPTGNGPNSSGEPPPANPTPSPPRKTPGRGSKATHVALPLATIAAISVLAGHVTPPSGPGSTPPSATAPAPLISGHEVQWWAVFKFNAAAEPTSPTDVGRQCTFGGTVNTTYKSFSQNYIVASADDPEFKTGQGLAGVGPDDPLGSTYQQIYNGHYHYVVWNDQFQDAPKIAHCTHECGAPWGHAKGLLAWDDAGDGMILQVTTPSWPGAASAAAPRTDDGNTLGCTKDNNLLFSQDFFALQLTKSDVVQVLRALSNASVVTDPSNPQLVNNGGPADISTLVAQLGQQSTSTDPMIATLSSGIELISKPSKLPVPPWQLVSAELGSTPLKVASWWAWPTIPSTDGTTKPGCWDDTKLAKPGAVTIVHSGLWQGKTIGLNGGDGAEGNHAKLGVSVGLAHNYAIFGDMNQQGALNDNCKSSQNGRGGMFFVVQNDGLATSLSSLLTDTTATEKTN